MRNRLIAVAICLYATISCIAPAHAQNNTNIGELSINFWKPAPEIMIQSGSITGASGGAITDFDFIEEFGIEDKSFPEFRFAVGRSHKFRLGYVPIKYEADAIVQRRLFFEGQIINIGVSATTDIKWNLWRFGYEWDFVSMEKGYFGVVGELKYNKMEASITSPALTTPAATDGNVPVPTIGVAARGYVHPMVAISGEWTGLKLTGDDFEAKFYDFDINGTVTFGRYVGVQGGFRSVTVDFLSDDDRGDLNFSGPYFGAHVKF